MGIQEALAHANLEGLLEQALDEGELDPDARTFPAARRRLVQHWLTTARPVFEGRAPLEAVRRERRELWAAAPPTERHALLAPSCLPWRSRPWHPWTRPSRCGGCWSRSVTASP
ncbi:hypothetical protein ABZ281_21150 [Streptomyces sp. NPDC006265]|uniref:hypothetical protein n=1 Tax=Streptomyces sp. NPDC006265 TaxID=3156740 RepID=UPI0033ACF9C2